MGYNIKYQDVDKEFSKVCKQDFLSEDEKGKMKSKKVIQELTEMGVFNR
jgi:hypothetical protein